MESFTWDNQEPLLDFITKSFEQPTGSIHEYSSIKDKIQTYDLIGFGTYMCFGKSLIGAVKSLVGEVCHVGIAIRGNDLPADHKHFSEDRVYILESNMSGKLGNGIYDLDMLKCEPLLCHVCCGVMKGPKCFSCAPDIGFNGVMLRDLEDMVTLDRQTGFPWVKEPRFYWAPLKSTRRPGLSEILSSAVRGQPRSLKETITIEPLQVVELLSTYVGTPYDYGCFGCCMLASLRTLCFGISWRPFREKFYKHRDVKPSNAIFCSELAVLVYQFLGILDLKVTAENAIPIDFFGQDRDGEIKFDQLFEDCVCFLGKFDAEKKIQ